MKSSNLSLINFSELSYKAAKFFPVAKQSNQNIINYQGDPSQRITPSMKQSN